MGAERLTGAERRAILNAIERLHGSYATEISRIEQESSIAESQLHDYQSRLGQTFAHENYLSELTHLRNALKDRPFRQARPNQARRRQYAAASSHSSESSAEALSQEDPDSEELSFADRIHLARHDMVNRT